MRLGTSSKASHDAFADIGVGHRRDDQREAEADEEQQEGKTGKKEQDFSRLFQM